jgi:hypothetical protein
MMEVLVQASMKAIAFGFAKARYRGVKKNTAQMTTLFALSNLWNGSPRSVTNISSRCHVLPGLRRAALARWANPAPNLSHRQRIVSSLRDFLRGVRDHDTTLKQQFLDVVQAQTEPEIPANRAADDDRREAMTVIKRFRFLHHFILPPTPHQPDRAAIMARPLRLPFGRATIRWRDRA